MHKSQPNRSRILISNCCVRTCSPTRQKLSRTQCSSQTVERAVVVFLHRGPHAGVVVVDEVGQKVLDLKFVGAIDEVLIGQDARATDGIDADDQWSSVTQTAHRLYNHTEEANRDKRETEEGDFEVGIHDLGRAVKLQKLAASRLEIFGHG